MHITRIELENIKSHTQSVFDFDRGTTAITGENGAGKTTLIEAVAWTLFDFLDYKKEDFVSRGSKKGTARVTFESGLDEREYTVVRDTGTGYNVFDPQLKMRIADKKEEVTRFLWQHLGVEPGTDLESLFRRAIGVPQGTFTAIFLESATERKKAFDKLLKVEEYRQGSDKLRDTVRYIENELAAVREKIARFEGELSRFETITANEKEIAARLAEEEQKLKIADEKVKISTQKLAEFDKAEAVFNEKRSAYSLLSSEAVRLETLLSSSKNDFVHAKNAASELKRLEPEHAKHLAALSGLKDLEQKRAARDVVKNDLAKLENQLVTTNSSKQNFTEKLERINTARAELDQLSSQIIEQETLEKELLAQRNELANAKAALEQQKATDERLVRLRESYKANRARLAEAETAANESAGIDLLRSREVEVTRSIAVLNAKLERDRSFQTEIKNGLCPILSQRCLNLKEGQTLDGFVSDLFDDLTTAIDKHEVEQREINIKLKTANDALQRAAALSDLKQRETEIKEEGERLNAEKAKLDEISGRVNVVETAINEVERNLNELADPKGRSGLLKREISDESKIKVELENVDVLLKDLSTQISELNEKLKVFSDVDENWMRLVGERDQTAIAFREYIANENAAALLSEKEKAFNETETKVKENASELNKAKADLDIAEKSYNKEKHNELRAENLSDEKGRAEIAVIVENLRGRRVELTGEIEKLAETRKLLTDDYQEKERLERVAEATKFIRDVLKDAAPQVAKNYVFHVSVEANNLFREIGGNAERTLKWTEDYGIILEEGGYDRPFSSLSGGEQMTAALSVRLALLKQLTDIRIAFFDEPTTNMDAERRENLAMQIGRITHFDQLFVISHDDTFEGYMDHELTVEKD